MKYTKTILVVGTLIILGIVLIPIIILWPRQAEIKDDPAANLPRHAPEVSHVDLMTGPYETPQDVTLACLECHPDSATQIMATSHWTWESEPFDVPWRDDPVTIGKANQINNVCIGAQGNEKRCMTCHVGYDWEEGVEYDYTKQANVDCLACHADMGVYFKGEFGNPDPSVDLVAAAGSVRNPTRDNCGACHFNGGGGNNVKHGDLDESLYYPSEALDVHMGREDFLCTDCHRTTDHVIKGRLVVDNYQVDPAEQVACTDCHIETPHDDDRINIHTASLACQTCHIPAMALKDPTKTFWDWSTSGQDLPEDHFTYLKIKGTFEYQKEFKPAYIWFNGNLEYRYILGDKIDPTQTTYINLPAGDISDPNAKIFPFKIHVARQPYDAINNYLMSPITAGTDGYWTNFNWDQAFELAESVTGLDYSGEYGFAETEMYWPTTHMVQPKDYSLQCTDCHSPDGRMDWEALGYDGDPLEWGGRFTNK